MRVVPYDSSVAKAGWSKEVMKKGEMKGKIKAIVVNALFIWVISSHHAQM